MPAGRPLRFRSPRVSDAKLVTSLQKSTFPWALEGDPLDAAQRFFQLWEDGRSQPRSPFLIAERDERFVGYASAQPFAPWVDGQDVISPDTPVAVLTQVAVVPCDRGSGAGSALVENMRIALGAGGFSVVIAHINPGLASWYSRMGWTVIPANCGFAWIEPPSSLNRRLLPPGAPDEVVSTHTPLLHQVPMGAHGYTTLAVAFTDAPMRVIAASFYEADDDIAVSGRRAAQSLIQALEGDSAALRKIPAHSAVLLHLSSLSGEDAATWAEEHLQGRSEPSESP